MNLQGSQRGGAKNLALHLLKAENDHVEIHELRGFVSDELVPALNEAHAISRGTKAKQFLFSVSFNPPPEENVPTAAFEQAIDRVENHFGLTGQPRAIVFHEKKGRRHAHAVWSRTDAEKMKAIPLPYTKRDLKMISRELYIEHGWNMPRGYMQSQERDPTNFTMAQWQQAKRIGKDPREIKTDLQDCWAISDTQAAFRQALEERGYLLARGDRRGFVAIDFTCEIFSISKKWIGVSAKEVRAKLTEPNTLPSVEDAKQEIARAMAGHLSELEHQHNQVIKDRLMLLEQKHTSLVQSQKQERQRLKAAQETRFCSENLQRQARFNKGFRGLFDRIMGKHRRIRQRNEYEAYQTALRDRQERDALIFRQLDERRVLQARTERLASFSRQRQRSLSRDMEQYKQIEDKQRETFKFSHRSQNRPDYER